MAGAPYVVHFASFAGRFCFAAEFGKDSSVRRPADSTRLDRMPIGTRLHVYLHPRQPAPAGGSEFSGAVTRTAVVRAADDHLRSRAVRRALHAIGC